ncbi:farnesyl-diphosphate synthase [Mycena rosella]|uniref:(2E,6E)-farnesyl diphosphate synthase n=1 Tax=Mycena rosella TaxID=1033263 RepID=A0AAD7GKC1_MYCRO|nr:farnesyl-diphosphate synthase [Mycena rosella]
MAAAPTAKFEEAWLVIQDELSALFAGQGMPKEAVEWYTKNLDYNVPGGKLNRGLAVVDSVQILKGAELTDDEYRKAAVLGWCVELAYFLVADDMMDGSITRRSQPCWYRLPAVGNIAINDACMLHSAVYRLLKVYFKHEPYYIDVVELFLDTTYQTESGQLLDLITAPEGHVDLSKFSLRRHQLIVTYKTAYYSFYLPVALAMRMSSVPENAPSQKIGPYKAALSILLPLGEYFQVQDDFLDFAGMPEQLGKIGTDIIVNKCSWCINTALAVASDAQRKILDENYGRKGAEEERRVKAVFEAIGLRERYAEYEREVYEKLSGMIEAIPEGKPGEIGGLRREVFTVFLDKIYRRTK